MYSPSFLVLAAIRLLKHFCPRTGYIFLLSDWLCAKYGPLRHLSQVSTMRFVARHTSVPVPKVHCALKRRRGCTLGAGVDYWIVMHKAEYCRCIYCTAVIVLQFRSIPHCMLTTPEKQSILVVKLVVFLRLNSVKSLCVYRGEKGNVSQVTDATIECGQKGWKIQMRI